MSTASRVATISVEAHAPSARVELHGGLVLPRLVERGERTARVALVAAGALQRRNQRHRLRRSRRRLRSSTPHSRSADPSALLCSVPSPRPPSPTFLVFAGLGAAGIVFVRFFIPETKDASLHEIEETLKTGAIPIIETP